jgi:hypothetical protein
MRLMAIILVSFTLLILALPMARAADDEEIGLEGPSDVVKENAPEEAVEESGEGAAEDAAELESEEADGWGEEGGWGKSFNYYGTLSYWHSLNRDTGTDKNEGELAMTFSYGEAQGRLRIGDWHPFATQRRDMRIEKYEVRMPLDGMELTVGTFAQLLGKGLVLSGIEERELDYDNEIEGIRLKLPRESYNVTAFVGQHKTVKDRGATKVWGGRVEVSPTEWFTMGGNVLSYQPTINAAPDAPAPRQHHQAMSWDVDFHWDKLSSHFEYMRLDWPQDDDGRGMYGNIVLSLPGFGLTYEYKNYYQINGMFAAPPPVFYDPEHAKADTLDEKGHGFTMVWSPFDNSSHFEASYAQSNIRNKGWPTTEAIFAYYSPTEKRTSWMSQYSYHRDVLLHERKWHTEVSRQWDDNWTTQVAVELRGVDKGSGTIDEQEVSLDIGYAGWLTLVLGQEKAGRGTLTEAQRWNIAELRLQEPGVQELLISYGKRREGFVCSGGICRIEPEFDGWKLAYVRYF